jgi:hypothetical protein
MYGLVNKAVEDLVKTNFGEDTWLKIKEEAQVKQASFVGMESYPDGITYSLVGAASKVLGASAGQILEAFGEYWVLYTAKEGYGDMLDMAGDNLRDFLHNLDALHVRVGTLMPQLQPPAFDCEDLDEHSLRLHYHTERAGLAPMVLGLVKGLGKRFNTECTVVQEASKADGADHDVFLVTWQ